VTAGVADAADALVWWVGGAIALVLLALCLRWLDGWLTGETRSVRDRVWGLKDTLF